MTTQERAAKVLQEIDAALALSEKATAGPWSAGTKGFSIGGFSFTPQPVGTSENKVATSDLAFIAASRNGWPKSLRCLRTAIKAILDGVEVYGTSSSWELQLRRLCNQWYQNDNH